ncbi:MAG: hypothetical protein AAFP84_09035 [Actinomycetota bacterium]
MTTLDEPDPATQNAPDRHDVAPHATTAGGATDLDRHTDHDVDELHAEVERLRAAEDAKRHPARRFSAATLAVIAALCVVFGAVGVWAERTLLDTDAWVDAVEPLPSDPAVADALAEFAADELFTTVDMERIVTDALPAEVSMLASPITDGLRAAAGDTVEEIVASDEFRSVWREVNQLAHEEALVLLRGDGDEVTSADGKVTINLVPLVNSLLTDLSSDASELFGTDIELPTVGETDLDTLRSALSSEFGVDLPADFAQVVVYDDGRLAEVQRALALLDDWTVGLFVLAVAAAVGALLLSIDRRRTVAHLAGSVAAVAALVMVIGGPIEDEVLTDIADSGPRAAAAAATGIALSGLDTMLLWLAVLGAVIATIAWLLGPSHLAIRVRTDGARTISAHRSRFQIGGVVVAVGLLVLLDPLTTGRFVNVLLVLAVYELLIVAVSDRSNPPITNTTTSSATPDATSPTTPTNQGATP